jgi:bifunctional DNA-binding transcriptional regulator/antitoxin component of YhaV-PrlF toxin-antitoxin module
MNLGVITQTNDKGQLVVPKSYRDTLGINPNVPLQLLLKTDGFYVRMIENVITKNTGSDLYLQLLDNTAGAWADDSWIQTENKRKLIEKKASHLRKKIW